MNEAVLTERRFAPPRVEVEHLDGGRMILRSPTPLKDYPAHLLEDLRHWAEAAPSRVFLAQRDGAGDWRKLTYREALQKVRSVAQSLLDRDIDANAPVMILSENSIESGVLQLAAMYVGAPAVPVSPSYSLISADFSKLRHVARLVEPALIFVSDGARYAGALNALDLEETELVVVENAPGGVEATSFDALLKTTATPDVEAALATVGPDTVAKILFTSGSTGMPKGVLNTQRMLCSNQQAMAQVWPFVENHPPILLDWLPWHHTFGGNHNFNMILRNGGSLYIDGGKPLPGQFETSVENLRSVAPTAYFNVPSGYGMLLPYLEGDATLRDYFFSRLELIFYAAAALPQTLWERLEKLSLAAVGRKIPMASAWGSTETAPLATSVHFPIDRAGVIGLPVPGCELLLVPNAGKLEVRVRGPNVTPGYFKQDALFAESIDEDGFYKIGDAVKFDDPDDPSKGVVFDGRIAEDFKLLTGSWVNVGKLRVNAIAAGAPIIRDAVVAGHDRSEIGLLVFPDIKGAAGVAGLDPDAPVDKIIASKKVHEALRRQIGLYNEDNPGSSTQIKRVLLLAEPPDIDTNEITDKGYISQRTVLERRADKVAQLYAGGPDVIVI
ncbi:MAG: feruloyl-CoA synthase [Parvularculaceae bacterium]